MKRLVAILISVVIISTTESRFLSVNAQQKYYDDRYSNPDGKFGFKVKEALEYIKLIMSYNDYELDIDNCKTKFMNETDSYYCECEVMDDDYLVFSLDDDLRVRLVKVFSYHDENGKMNREARMLATATYAFIFPGGTNESFVNWLQLLPVNQEKLYTFDGVKANFSEGFVNQRPYTQLFFSDPYYSGE